MSFGSSIAKAVSTRPLLIGGGGLLLGGSVLSSILGGTGDSNPISSIVGGIGSTFQLLPQILPLALIGGAVFYFTK